MIEEGWRCTFVSRGGDAIEQLSKKKHDLIVLDLGLQEPGHQNSLSRGADVFRQIRERTDTPILIITISKNRLPGRELIKQLKPDYCIPKPFTPGDLRNALREIGLG